MNSLLTAQLRSKEEPENAPQRMVLSVICAMHSGLPCDRKYSCFFGDIRRDMPPFYFSIFLCNLLLVSSLSRRLPPSLLPVVAGPGAGRSMGRRIISAPGVRLCNSELAWKLEGEEFSLFSAVNAATVFDAPPLGSREGLLAISLRLQFQPKLLSLSPKGEWPTRVCCGQSCARKACSCDSRGIMFN